MDREGVGEARRHRWRSLSTLSTTTSGRHLGFIDFEHGPTNLMGQHIAEAVAFDIVTGKQVIQDHTENGGRFAAEGLADLYSEDPDLHAFDDKHAYMRTDSGSGFFRYDFATG